MNRNLDRINAERLLDRDSFNRFTTPQTTMPNRDFELQYRMPRSIYEIIRKSILWRNKFFKEIADATGVKIASTNIKILAAMLMLAEGGSARSLFQKTRMSESLNLECMKQFVYTIVKEYEQ